MNKSDLAKYAEEILLAREGHFPATIADLYDPKKMPSWPFHAVSDGGVGNNTRGACAHQDMKVFPAPIIQIEAWALSRLNKRACHLSAL